MFGSEAEDEQRRKEGSLSDGWTGDCFRYIAVSGPDFLLTGLLTIQALEVFQWLIVKATHIMAQDGFDTIMGHAR